MSKASTPACATNCSTAFAIVLEPMANDGAFFYTLNEARIVIESWRHYNSVRPHESLGYGPPAPEVVVTALAAWPSGQTRTASTATLPMASRPIMH
jgi:putative transposase